MGISAEVFHEMIGVKDAYKAPERLLEILYNREEREQLFRDFLAATSYNVDDELNVTFTEHLYGELLESPGVPEHVVKSLMEGDDSREPSEATKFIYALCGVDGFNFKTEETTS